MTCIFPAHKAGRLFLHLTKQMPSGIQDVSDAQTPPIASWQFHGILELELENGARFSA